MRGKWTSVILLGGLAVLAIVLLFLFGGEKSEPEEKDKPVNWDISFEHDDRDPYGTFLFYQLLKRKYRDENIHMRRIIDDFSDLHDTVNKKPDLYFLVSNAVKLNYEEKEMLMDFVGDGNFAFVAVEKFPQVMTAIIEEGHFITTHYLDKLRLNFYDSSLALSDDYYDFVYFYDNKKQNYYWRSFQRKKVYPVTSYADTEEGDGYNEDTSAYSEDLYYSEPVAAEALSISAVLEYNNELNDVMIRIPYGQGAFYFHSVPLCFTNLSLLKEKNVEHLEKVLACLPDGVPVWDSYAQMDYITYLEEEASSYGNGGNGRGDKARQSPMQFILSKPSLKWAYYVLLATLLLYIIFQVKRKQKVIPAVPKNVNSSLDFIQTVSKLYYQQYRHKNLLKHKFRILLNFIRERYYLSTAKPDVQFIQLLARKSQVEEDRLSRMFKTFEIIEKSSHVSDEMLIALHQEVEYFYKNCK